MGDSGKKDKGKREQRKKPKLTIKEKRKQKKEKHINTTGFPQQLGLTKISLNIKSQFIQCVLSVRLELSTKSLWFYSSPLERNNFLPLALSFNKKRVIFKHSTTYLLALFLVSCAGVYDQPTGLVTKTAFPSQPNVLHDS